MPTRTRSSTLWELAVTATRWPQLTASAMMRAAAVVFPVPSTMNFT
jgi:hypothetical protein